MNSETNSLSILADIELLPEKENEDCKILIKDLKNLLKKNKNTAVSLLALAFTGAEMVESLK